MVYSRGCGSWHPVHPLLLVVHIPHMKKVVQVLECELLQIFWTANIDPSPYSGDDCWVPSTHSRHMSDMTYSCPRRLSKKLGMFRLKKLVTPNPSMVYPGYPWRTVPKFTIHPQFSHHLSHLLRGLSLTPGRAPRLVLGRGSGDRSSGDHPAVPAVFPCAAQPSRTPRASPCGAGLAPNCPALALVIPNC